MEFLHAVVLDRDVNFAALCVSNSRAFVDRELCCSYLPFSLSLSPPPPYDPHTSTPQASSITLSGPAEDSRWHQRIRFRLCKESVSVGSTDWQGYKPSTKFILLPENNIILNLDTRPRLSYLPIHLCEKFSLAVNNDGQHTGQSTISLAVPTS